MNQLSNIYSKNAKTVFMVRVEGAGNKTCNGLYVPTGEKNGVTIFQSNNGVCITRESIGGKLGWIIGLTPKAFYGVASMDPIPPKSNWKAYAEDILPTPVISIEKYSEEEAAVIKSKHQDVMKMLLSKSVEDPPTGGVGSVSGGKRSGTKNNLPTAQRIAMEQEERRNFWMQA